MGLFWKRVGPAASLASVAAGIVTAVVWVAIGMNNTLNVVYPTIIVSYIVGIIVTLMSKPVPAPAKQ